MGERTQIRRKWYSAAAPLLAGALALAGGAAAGTPVERGQYLVESILACGNCHTPKSPRGAPVMACNMAGGITIDTPPLRATASNITPDRETGIGDWSGDETRRAIIDGVGLATAGCRTPRWPR